MAVFKVKDTVSALNSIMPEEKVVMQDLNEPKGQRVQKIYIRLLYEFGYKEAFFVPSSIEYLPPSVEHPEMHHETYMIDCLMIGLRSFFQKIVSDITFGIMDLVDPDPKRTRRFLALMVNFWNFASQQAKNFEGIKEEVDKQVSLKTELLDEIEKLDRKIEEARQKRASSQIAFENMQDELNRLEEEMSRCVANNDRIKEEVDEQKRIRDAVLREASGLKSEIEAAEEREAQFNGVISFKASMKSLETELENVQEDMNGKQQRETELNKAIKRNGELKQDFEHALSLLQAIALKLENVQKVQQDSREIQLEKEAVKQDFDDVSSQVLAMKNQLHELRMQIGKTKQKWSAKKQALEAEKNAYETELKAKENALCEEEKTALELRERIEEAKKEIKQVREETSDEQAIQAEYKELLTTIELFNQTMEKRFEKAQAVAEKMQCSSGKQL